MLFSPGRMPLVLVLMYARLANAPRGLDTLEMFWESPWAAVLLESNDHASTSNGEMMAMAAAAAAAIAAGGLGARHTRTTDVPHRLTGEQDARRMVEQQ